MKKSDISFDQIPASALSTKDLSICLKCAFDFFLKQLKMAARTAYSELRKHVPNQEDFLESAATRPHFIAAEKGDRCPYCNAPKRWFGRFRAIRIEAHPSFEKDRRKLWAALKKKPERFALWNPKRTQMQIFSEWLDRVNRKIDFEDTDWPLKIAVEHVRHSYPSHEWEALLGSGVRRVQLSRHLEDSWSYDNQWLYVSPLLYGDILVVQHLISRSHLHGGRTFEGRLTLQELIGRLRRLGYLESRGIDTREPYEAFEQAVASVVANGPTTVYYAVDRDEYLKKLKSVYEKKRTK